MKWKDLSLKERKQIYDSVRVNNPGATYFDIKEQFDSIPAYEDGGKSIVDEVNKSDANFVQRLKSPTRQTIPNWEDQYRVLPWEKSVSTHKLSVWDNANGGGIIVPDVQEVNGKLIDFTRPLYNNRAAVENALKTGDYVDLPKFEDALWYTENYKRYYPRFEDGGKNKNVPVLPKELGLTPGTPEYLERQKRISGSANVVQPEAYITPAGYIKDAVNFIEDLGKGDYAGAAMDAVLNLIPWGVGKGIKKLKSKVVKGTEIACSIVHSFAPTQTKKKTEEGDDSEFSEVLRKDRNSKKYQQEISRTTEAKSHMLTLKRSLKDSGKITNWSTPVDENMILEYMRNPTSNKMVKNQYDLYRNKNEYIDRLNKLIPMENLYPVYPIPSYKDGGIHIKKKNRGKFNALKKRTGKSTEELTHSKNPLTRKRAIFAQNAAKWNHKGRKKK